MGLADGPTLADRIEQGSIHRDLKPANMKLRPDGVVLDFGLRGQTPGATQRCLNLGFSERIGNSRRTGGVARRSASHVRYDSGDTPSIAAHDRLQLPQRDPALTQRAGLHDVTPCHRRRPS